MSNECPYAAPANEEACQHMNTTAVRSVLERAGQAALASTIGLIGLPFIFTSLSNLDLAHTWLWLAIAIGVSGWLLAVAPVISRCLGQLLAQVPAPGLPPERLSRAAADVGRLVVAIGYLVLVQAIVRGPLVAISIGSGADRFNVEATFAATALIALFGLLGWLYQGARVLIEGVASGALDSVLTTVDSDATTAPAPRTLVPAVTRLASAQHAASAATMPAPTRIDR